MDTQKDNLISEELRRLQTEHQALRAGYDAARLEVQSLRERCKTQHAAAMANLARIMGLERAAAPAPGTALLVKTPTLWVVHMDGRILAVNDEPGHLDGAQAVPYVQAPFALAQQLRAEAEKERTNHAPY